MRVHHLHGHPLPHQGGCAVSQPGDVDRVVSDQRANGGCAAFLAAHRKVFVAGEKGVGECLADTMHSEFHILRTLHGY